MSHGDYYQELSRAREPAQRAGWRHRLEQWLRFELTCAALRPHPGDHIVDLGCGPAALAAYLHPHPARYLGVERHPAVVDHARQTLATLSSDANLLHADLFDPRVDAAGPFTLAIAIGALVDGRASTRAQRAERASAHVRRVLELAGQGAALFVLDQTALDADPIRSLEPALLGIHEHELRAIATELSQPLTLAQPIAGEWMVLAGARPANFDALAERATCGERVLERWRAAGGHDPADHTWLWWVAGEHSRAFDAFAKVPLNHPRHALLKARLELMDA
ncbi:class I SAM-dependent methyltransferase [Lujinxingia vulgaris]|uniref:Class I SAM-dependent methyltransferase n=1 Tax=Lujinxingia vulgaris TaxID=2600176 RepID=A0A5C6XMF6_9DELT|nr:class I SAM-dependent methyltransferase [Lujinxingia vulgaris]TXD39405.1 class I SAM-dependent methyltransferase [Lujinxingia vulgaris]